MNPQKNTKTLLLFFIFLFLPVISYSEKDNKRQSKAAQLETLRIHIKDVETGIQKAKNQVEKLQKELRKNEIATVEILKRSQNIALAIEKKNAKLEDFQRKQTEHEKTLKKEKEKLKNQIRVAYQIGRNNYIKLILNQQDPGSIGRALTYHNYNNHSRTTRINRVKKSLEEIVKIKISMEQEKIKLQQLKIEHETRLNEFRRYRVTRGNIIEHLRAYIDEHGIKLHNLQKNEHELVKLLQSLKKEKTTAIAIPKEIPPFDSLKGKLPWPIKGKILKSFGSRKKGGNLRWRGVLIDAESAAGVSAVGVGKIVFADWFRNLGLLIIIDHGDSYMSLYGHNRNLLKNSGDWVSPGEKIATVGDSGGQSDIALYFEIRKGAEPLDPEKWCKK